MTDMPSMTVAEAMGDIPDIIGASLGDKTLEKCLAAASLPTNVFQHVGSYIPEIAIDRFLDTAARQSGDDLIGLYLAPHLSVEAYGKWGDYVLEAPDLLTSLTRACSIIHLHADRDTLRLCHHSEFTRLEYTFAERTGRGYRQIALLAVGSMLSIPRHYLGQAWTPRSIDLDMGGARFAKRIEAKMKCNVRSDWDCVAIEIPNSDLSAKNPKDFQSWTTLRDVERACGGGPPQGIVPLVEAMVLQRLDGNSVTLEDIAGALAMSKRTLQRRFDQDGTEFRRVVGAVKMRRATELLADTSATVSEIGSLLDYSTTSHFSRAFKMAHGVSPTEFRASRNGRVH